MTDDEIAEAPTELPESMFRGIERGTSAYRYRGARCVKNPIDMAIIAALLFDVKPRTIIEVGSFEGGSALWMRDLMRSYGVACEVHSVDVNLVRTAWPLDCLRFYHGDGRRLDKTFSDAFMREQPHPLFMIEDADHQPETTAAVLAFFHRWSRPGEYIVVEDGDADKYDPHKGYNGGPAVAIARFLRERVGAYEVDRRYADMFGITFNPEGYIRRVR